MRRIASLAGLALAVLTGLGAAAPAQAQSAADYITYYQWNADRWLTMKIGPDPDGPNLRPDGTPSAKRRAERYTYDDDGQLIQTDVGTVDTVAVSATGVVTVTGWNPLQTTQVRYDPVGNKTQVLAAAGTTAATLTQTRYDADDRPLCVAVRMNPTSAALTDLYNASATPDACVSPTTTGPNADRITKTVYDAAGQVLQTLQALGTADERTYATYTYTDNGKQATIEDARFNRTTLRYDGFDRLCRQEFPSTAVGAHASNGPPAPQGQTYLACRPTLAEAQAATSGDFEEYGYDKSGNKTWQRKRDNGGLSYTYDPLNRMTVKSGSNIATVNSAYDLTGKPTDTTFGVGGPGVIYKYDTAGRLSSEKSYDRELKFEYDAAGNRTKVTWPDGAYATYVYDAASQPKTVTAGNASITYIHDDLGRRSDLNRVGAAKDHFGYDPGNRPTNWTLTFTGAGKNQSDVLGYNPASQLVSEALGNDLYRWTGVNNSLTATADGLNRDAALAAISGYDLNQNLIKDNSRSFTYDGENRLTTVTGPASATLAYDPLGRLRETTINGVVTQFLYDGDKLTAEFSGSATTPLRRYLHGVGTDVPLVWFEGADLANIRYLHPDRQGSIVAWSDASGVSQATYTYGPYGEPGDNWAAGSRFRYTGQIALPELKLYHYKARVYDPMRGWFLQTDPIGYKDDLNLYAYTGEDPVNRSDPTGTESPCVAHGNCFGDPNDPETGQREGRAGMGLAVVAGVGVVAIACTSAPSACAKVAQAAAWGAGFGALWSAGEQYHENGQVDVGKAGADGLKSAVSSAGSEVGGLTKIKNLPKTAGKMGGAYLGTRATGGNNVEGLGAAAGALVSSFIPGGKDDGFFVAAGRQIGKKTSSKLTKELIKALARGWQDPCQNARVQSACP